MHERIGDNYVQISYSYTNVKMTVISKFILHLSNKSNKMNQTTGYKVAPFDLEIALKNPDWVYFRNGEKPLEWHWFKASKGPFHIHSIDEKGAHRSATKTGNYCDTTSLYAYDLILRIPTKKVKLTVFVWPNGHTESYSDYEPKRSSYESFCAQAEQGHCTRHEFEVEI